MRKLLGIFVLGVFLVSNAQASWVIVNSDGSTQKLNNCCPKKKYVKKVVVEPEICVTCDYSNFKDAPLLPVGNEKLQPATLKDCGK